MAEQPQQPGGAPAPPGFRPRGHEAAFTHEPQGYFADKLTLFIYAGEQVAGGLNPAGCGCGMHAARLSCRAVTCCGHGPLEMCQGALAPVECRQLRNGKPGQVPPAPPPSPPHTSPRFHPTRPDPCCAWAVHAVRRAVAGLVGGRRQDTSEWWWWWWLWRKQATSSSAGWAWIRACFAMSCCMHIIAMEEDACHACMVQLMA